MKWSKAENRKEIQQKKRLTNVCVFSVHHHFLELYNTCFTIPEGSVNSVPLLRPPLTFYFPSHSPPFSFTIEE
jgi:hypothetical protein